MKEKMYFSIVLPLDAEAQELAQRESDRNQLRAVVWSQAAEHMKALLGKTCSQFSPAPAPGENLNKLPYGVALGIAEPKEFLIRYVIAQEVHDKELHSRKQRILSLGRPLFDGQIFDGIELTVLDVAGNDPSIRREVKFVNCYRKHDITAAAGLYFLKPNRCYLSGEEERHLLSHLCDYAICVAELVPMEGEA